MEWVEFEWVPVHAFLTSNRNNTEYFQVSRRACKKHKFKEVDGGVSHTCVFVRENCKYVKVLLACTERERAVYALLSALKIRGVCRNIRRLLGKMCLHNCEKGIN